MLATLTSPMNNILLNNIPIHSKINVVTFYHNNAEYNSEKLTFNVGYIFIYASGGRTVEK